MRSNDGTGIRTGLRQTWGGLLLAMGLVALLSLLTYHWSDVSALSVPPNEYLQNCFGLAGAWLSYSLLLGFGLAAYLVPLVGVAAGCFLILRPEEGVRRTLVWSLVLLAAASVLLDLHPDLFPSFVKGLNIPASGGVLAHFLTRRITVPIMQVSGTAIVASLVLLVALIRLIGYERIVSAFRLLGVTIERGKIALGEWSDRRRKAGKLAVVERQERLIEKRREKLAEAMRKEKEREREREAPAPPRPKPELKKEKKPRPEPPPEPDARVAAGSARSSLGAAVEYQLPPLSLLDEVPPARERAIEGDTAVTGRVIRETLAEFEIETEVVSAEQGPVVTLYELRPAAGVRVERISSLSNNLALALKATSVRVMAPIPGKGVVGVEVPNTIASKVFLRETLDGEAWRDGGAAIPLALGKDVGGNDVVADLATMPHLLIAGATGSGKTVCMNAILTGLLMRCSPAYLRLVLVDPKIVEFALYDGLPHLVAPVITDPHKVVFGLRWAINEMEKRYKLFAKTGVRNIESYNRRPIVEQQSLPLADVAGTEERNELPAHLPYIVVVVDELADLMLVAQADIENCIARLAQLSRAVGIHMILATQRPSVNIITGTIKANFPSRIAFQVAQRVDSRTILDANGADKLLGRGDMLFLPPGSSKLIRAQGAMVTDHETRRVVEYIKERCQPNYEESIREKTQAGGSGTGSVDAGEDDELFDQAVQIVRETRRASTSSLQRRLRIGYTRAARLMDIMEEKGIVGPPRGSDPREILIDLDVEPSAAGEAPAGAPEEEDADTEEEEGA